jgi:hypothetical protein
LLLVRSEFRPSTERHSCFQVLDGPSFDFSGPFACKNQVKFVSMMEMARDHRAGGNLVNVCDHLFVGDTNKIAFSQVRNLISCKPALLLAEYKRNTVHKSHQRNTADDMTGLHVMASL